MSRIISFLCILLISPCYIYAQESACLQHHCLAVIDAGSSASRLHVYAYDLDETNTPIEITEIWNKKILPGLSTIEHEHRSVSVYMEKLFTDAPVASMPVYFYSTAGMRLLPKSSHKNVYQLVSDWFDKQYYWNLTFARTITGQEEGMFAWLATNYQLKLLNQTEKPLAAVMDIGGASVQIAIPLKDDINVDKNDLVELNLYGKKHFIFSRSFLGLGQNEMGHQFFDNKSCYPDEYELPGGHTGQGDAYACRDKITTLVNNIHSVKQSIEPVLALNSIDNWYLIGGIAFMLQDKLFPASKKYFTNQEILQFADKNICHQKWSNLEERYPGNHMLYNYCLLSSYLYALIVNGYGLSQNQNINLVPHGNNVDWTIGVVLQHSKS